MAKRKSAKRTNGKPEPKVVGESFLGYYLERGEAKPSRILIVGNDAIVYDARKRRAKVLPASAAAKTVKTLLDRKKPTVHYHLSWDGSVVKVRQAAETGDYIEDNGKVHSHDRIFRTKRLAYRFWLKSRNERLRQIQKNMNRISREVAQAKRKLQAASKGD